MTNTIVIVGTNKGAFIYAGDKSRRDWAISAPHMPGWEVSALHMDRGKPPRIYAGTTHHSFGATIRVSDDHGRSWREMEARPQHSKESGFKSERIWQIANGHSSEPQTIYAGLADAGLFVSCDRAESWQEVSALSHIPNRAGWFPGNGGLCLHTILVDPKDAKRMWVAISAVGVFRTTDGGESWHECNNGLPKMETGVKENPTCCCVHKVVLDPKNSNTLFMQFHGGVFKSTDGADSWQRIESGLPGNFGFPMVISARGELFIAPLEADEKRYFKDGKFAIYRSRDAGISWTAQTKGLPSEPQYVGVLRDAMAADTLEPAGVYVGTTMGEVFSTSF